ncbi:hypothetical protein DC74_8149 [Streptomyces noursei]|nr:hypothetical protein DC74_8149 [Streptomyces noursei]
MLGPFGRAYREWRRRRAWHRYVDMVEPVLLIGARRALIPGLYEAQSSPTGRGFVSVRSVIDEVRTYMRMAAIREAFDEANGPDRRLEAATGRGPDDLDALPAWMAAAALRHVLDRRAQRNAALPIDSDAYDPDYARPTTAYPSPAFRP